MISKELNKGDRVDIWQLGGAMGLSQYREATWGVGGGVETVGKLGKINLYALISSEAASVLVP